MFPDSDIVHCYAGPSGCCRLFLSGTEVEINFIPLIFFREAYSEQGNAPDNFLPEEAGEA